MGALVVAVTLGKEGTLISKGEQHEIVPSITVNSIDSTGAGDSIVGATLFQLAKKKEPRKALENFEELKDIIAFSNCVGAIVCTKAGAISAIPTLEESLAAYHNKCLSVD
jgi:fructokinase